MSCFRLPVSKPSSSLQITEVTDSVDTTGSDVTATRKFSIIASSVFNKEIHSLAKRLLECLWLYN